MDIELRIGIIDDDQSKVTQIMMKLMEGIKGAASEKVDKYSKYLLKPHELSVRQNQNDMIEEIIEAEIDCLIIDYNLSSYVTVDYTGIDFAKSIYEMLYDFPIFILTSYEDDLFANEIFNAYQVFDFSRYLNEDAERIELNYKIIEQILKYKKQKEQWEYEIKGLLPLAGTSQEIDSKLLELDANIEKSINGKHSLPQKMKKDLNENKLNELLNKIDELLERE